MTEAEKRLWRELREVLTSVRFRRQHPIGRHIVDFACPAAKLAIELDGGQHAIWHDEDRARSLEIARRGCRVMRFWNGDVMGNITGVLETIRRELNISLSAPGGGEGRGEVGGAPASEHAGATHLTLPSLARRVPSLSPQKGGEGAI
jgi:BirA family biotin operon repressor/biotin-[acetyl-CoA-carboxylase] ligase